jgi:predicted nucleotide-binding protein
MESALGKLQHLLEAGKEFTFDNFSFPNDYGRHYGGQDSTEWLAWKTRVSNTILDLVEENSAPAIPLNKAQEICTEGNYLEQFDRQKSTLLAAIEGTLQILKDDTFGESKRPKSQASSASLSNRIFIVHGHDHALKTELETFLTTIGVESVVLHRQPDKGRTLIEKFEQHADVGFAFILLTPDEVACTADQASLPELERKTEYRARPNVIFEFGYFVGKLGRERVCCVVKGDVSRPSDIDGLVYKPIPESLDSIKFSLIMELKAAGYTLRI